ncbi:MAG: thiamine phosphate synthase [Cyanobacteria bacterium J06554_11]
MSSSDAPNTAAREIAAPPPDSLSEEKVDNSSSDSSSGGNSSSDNLSIFSYVKSSPLSQRNATEPPKNFSVCPSNDTETDRAADHATGGVAQLATADRRVLFRILDANLDRAREGVRVVEEWCRFGLNDEAAMAQLKHLRQVIAGWHTPDIRAARDTPGDLGTALTHPQEAVRSSLAQVLQVNLARAQEALRVLEEYGKLHSAEMATGCKQMRYQLYTLDSQIMEPFLPSDKSDSRSDGRLAEQADLKQRRFQQLARAKTYLVTSPVDNLLDVVESALQGGIAIVQHREKKANDEERLAIAQQLRTLCHRYGALFIVNDRVDIAIAADADGVHLGQQDLPMNVARQILGPDRIVGRSTTNPQELQRAIDEAADYVGVGPVYATPTKPGKAAAGNEYVRYAAQHAPMPWFTIGGLNADNIGPTLTAGATRVAVVRALMEADDPEAIARSLVQQTQQAL